MPGDRATARAPDGELALDLIETLAGEIGPRRPTSRAEAVAAEVLRDVLGSRGVAARVEPFPAYASFGYPYGVIGALACAPALLPRRWRGLRGAVAALGAALLAAEGGLLATPLSAGLARRATSRNVVATIEPTGEPARTLCLMAHLDSSRSGLLFHPAAGPYLRRWLELQSAASFALAAEPVLARTPAGRAVIGAARAASAAGLALLAERELRGVDVAGANDNASGAAAVVQLAVELASARPEATRIVVLIAGSEEAGMLGARAFLRGRETRGWLFLNFDGVGAPAPLRYLRSEGIVRKWPADPALVRLAESVRADRPELGLEPAVAPIGLTYDATAVLARGGRALTLVAGDDDGRIPNYHQPTDTVSNLDLERLDRALEVGRALIAGIERGEADRRPVTERVVA